MAEPTDLVWREQPTLPREVVCADCGAGPIAPYGWCGGCRKAMCFACGRTHFCTAGCPGNGCIAGLCVREVRAGLVSNAWGLPDDE